MKNKKEKENISISVRINKSILADFNNQLTKIYGINQRKKSVTINKLILDYNKQDANKLKNAIQNNQTLINLDAAELQQTIKEKQDKIEQLNNICNNQQRQNEKLENKNKQLQSIIEAMTKADDDKSAIIESLKKIADDKDKTITALKVEKDAAIQDAKAEKDAIIDDLKADKKTLTNNNQNLSADNKQLNQLLLMSQNENKKLSIQLTAFKNMSFIDRLLNRYPADNNNDDDIIAIADDIADANANNDATDDNIK